MTEETKKILIVEDELIIALMIEQMVQTMGHQVIGKITSGEQAVEMVLDSNPDVVLMDIRLNGSLDGIEAMHQIRKKKDIPFIFMTGNTNEVYRNKIGNSERTSFLSKPVTLSELNRAFGLVS